MSMVGCYLLLSHPGGVFVSSRRCFCLAQEGFLSHPGGVFVSPRRVFCLARRGFCLVQEGFLSPPEGFLSCPEGFLSHSGGVFVSPGGVFVSPRRGFCLARRVFCLTRRGFCLAPEGFARHRDYIFCVCVASGIFEWTFVLSSFFDFSLCSLVRAPGVWGTMRGETYLELALVLDSFIVFWCFFLYPGHQLYVQLSTTYV